MSVSGCHLNDTAERFYCRMEIISFGFPKEMRVQKIKRIKNID
jgi:hypothetical protein